MKQRKRRLMSLLLAGIVAITAVAIIPEYRAQHDYYTTMIQSYTHRGMLLSGIAIVVIGIVLTRTVS